MQKGSEGAKNIILSIMSLLDYLYVLNYGGWGAKSDFLR